MPIFDLLIAGGWGKNVNLSMGLENGPNIPHSISNTAGIVGARSVRGLSANGGGLGPPEPRKAPQKNDEGFFWGTNVLHTKVPQKNFSNFFYA